jgi:hypothetical protein
LDALLNHECRDEEPGHGSLRTLIRRIVDRSVKGLKGLRRYSEGAGLEVAGGWGPDSRCSAYAGTRPTRRDGSAHGNGDGHEFCCVISYEYLFVGCFVCGVSWRGIFHRSNGVRRQGCDQAPGPQCGGCGRTRGPRGGGAAGERSCGKGSGSLNFRISNCDFRMKQDFEGPELTVIVILIVH